MLSAFIEGYDPTGPEYRKYVIIDGQECVMEIDPIDEAGLSRMPVEQWSSRSLGIVLLFDVTSTESFSLLNEIHERVLAVRARSRSQAARGGQIGAFATSRDPNGVLPLIVVGNKSDLVEKRQVGYERGRAFAVELECDFFEVSAKCGSNVDAAFEQLVRAMRVRRARPRLSVSTVVSGKRTELFGRKSRRNCMIL